MIDRLWQDVRYTVRSLAKAPLFTFAAVATLALGIGANAALFVVADATALRPPDVPNAANLVRVFSSTEDTLYGELPFPDYDDFRRQATSVSGLVAYESADVALAKTTRTSAIYLGGWLVSANSPKRPVRSSIVRSPRLAAVHLRWLCSPLAHPRQSLRPCGRQWPTSTPMCRSSM